MKNPPFSSPSQLGIILSLASVGATHAVDRYWDNNGGAGNHAWGTGTNWSNNAAGTGGTGAPATGGGDDVFFNTTPLTAGSEWVGLNSNRTADSITVRSTATGGTTIRSRATGTTAHTLNLRAGGITVESGAGAFFFRNGSGANADGSSSANTGVLTVNLTANQTWNVDNAAGMTSFSRIIGNFDLTKTGSGRLLLANNGNAYGKTIINEGIVAVDRDTRLGATPGAFVADSITLNGGTLETTAGFTLGNNRGITLGANGGTFAPAAGTQVFTDAKVTGVGDLTVDGPGTFMLRGNTNDYSGDTFVNQGTLRVGTPGGSANNRLPTETVLTLGSGTESGAFDMNAQSQVLAGLTTDGTGTANRVFNNSGLRVLTIRNSDDYTYDGTIEANLSLLKQDTGTFTLTGTNDYNGTTTVSAGTLVVDGDISSSSSITVGSGATFGGSGVGGDLHFEDGGQLDMSLGTITLLDTASLTFDNFDFDDLLNSSYLTDGEGFYTLIDGDFTLDSTNVLHFGEENALDRGDGFQVWFSEGSFGYTVGVVPEPSTALLSMIAIAGLFGIRRRK